MVSYILSGLYFLYSILLLGWFSLRIKKEPLNSRAPFFVYMSVIFSIFSFAVAAFLIEERKESSSVSGQTVCKVYCWSIILSIPLWLLPHFARVLILYFKHEFNMLKKSNTLDESYVPRALRLRTLTGYKANLAIITGIFLINLITGIAIEFTYPTDVERNISNIQNCSGRYTYLLIGQAVAIIFLYVISVVILWKVNDGFHFKSEFSIYGFLVPIMFIAFFVSAAIKGQTYYVALSLFMFFFFVTLNSSLLYPIALSFSARFFSHNQGSSTTNSSSSSSSSMKKANSQLKNVDLMFHEVLSDVELLGSFVDFAATMWCAENIFFYLAVERFERTGSVATRKEMALQIRAEFIENGALRQINMDESIRRKILFEIEQGNIHEMLFQDAKDHVARVLKFDTFAKWQLSKEFKLSMKESNSRSKVNIHLVSYHDELASSQEGSFKNSELISH